jgi:GNAT superfamily N-acetyltransferase
LDPRNPRLPEPIDVANLATPDEPELGRRLLDGLASRRDGSGLDLVKHMPSAEASTQSHSGFGARLKRLFGLGADSRANRDCAHLVADELSTWYYGRDFRVATARSEMGTPAWALFEAVGTRAEFANYDDIPGRLRQLGDGAAAVLVSRWAGGRHGGHAYLAVNEAGDIYLYDPHSGERSSWPPHWGQDAVSHTAAGYLKPDGSPEHALDHTALQQQLAHADAVGDVLGHPVDPDFLRDQANYRAQDPVTRIVDSRYADPLGDIVDDASEASARQLADDLTGVFGPYRVDQFRADVTRSGDVIIGGHILNGDDVIGFMQRTFGRDADGNLVAHHDAVEIYEERFKFKGFSRELYSQLESYYARSGVDRIELSTEQDGGHVWGLRGFTWNTDSTLLEHSLQNVREAAQRLFNWVSDDAQAVLRETVQRLEVNHPRLPEPVELATLATPDQPDLGRQLMYGTKWFGVKHLLRAPTDESTDLSRAELDTSLETPLAEQLRGINCAHLVADALWQMYGREIRIEAPVTSTGVPARALFEAIGTNARFATYDEVADELRRLGPGSSAVLASRWAGGRQGGHAYLAINVDDEIFLVESHSGQQLGWPPHWGEDAVARTAVGYLDPEGNPTHPLTDVPLQLQLADADAIGDVAGPPQDPDFLRQQQEYRAQDLTTRPVDSRYAEPVGDVVDNASDPARVHQLAEDLSGIYGPYRVELERVEDEATGLAGPILNGDQSIGGVYWSFHRDGEGYLVATHGLIDIQERFRGQGFSRALSSQLEPYYERSGIDRIELTAAWQGAYAWASWGFTWDPDPHKLQESLDSIRDSARRLSAGVDDDARAALDDVVGRLDPEHPRLPEPMELARLSAPGHPQLGRELLDYTRWHAVRYLRSVSPDVPAPDIPLRLDVADASDNAGGDDRADYRAADKLARQADPQFADPLGDVLDAVGPDGDVPAQAYQLAADLSGRYGPFAVNFDGVSVVGSEHASPSLYLEGEIIAEDGRVAGNLVRVIHRDDDGNLVVFNSELYLEEWAQRQGFATALYHELERYYRRCGVDRIEVEATFRGGYAWARLGFDWNPTNMAASVAAVHDRAVELADDPSTSDSALIALSDVIDRSGPNHPDPPTPLELANLATEDTPDLGVKLMTGLEWSGVVWLREEG